MDRKCGEETPSNKPNGKVSAFVPWICRLYGVFVVSGIWKELTNAQ